MKKADRIMQNNIGCIVVLFNPEKEVLQRIERYPVSISPIILIDNSLSNNINMFKRIKRDDVQYYSLGENTGIAHALNVGIMKIKKSVDYVITMDQDSELTEQVSNVYYKAIKNKNERVLAPNYETDRKKRIQASGYNRIKLSMQSGMLFKTDVFDVVGLFDERLFLDVVDFEYCLRLGKKDIPITRCNEAVLYHQPAQTKEKHILFYKLRYGIAPPLRYYYQARNLLWTARKYRSIKLYELLVIKLFKIILLFDDKKKYIDYFVTGIKDANSNKLGKRDRV